jgi:hypothetical protein
MNEHHVKQETAAKKLRRMIQCPRKITLCPGVYDGLSALVALSVGFDALYMVSTCSLLLWLKCHIDYEGICRLGLELVHLVLGMLI